MVKSTPNYGGYLLLASLIVMLAVISASSGCFEEEEAVKVSLQKTEIPENRYAKNMSVRIGVFSMASPKTTMLYYQDLLKYLSDDTGIQFELVQRDNPAEINYLLQTKYLDAVFVREADYFIGYENFGMDIIAVPIIDANITYLSYVVTRYDEDIDSFDDLRDKRFAFNSYRFNEGEVVPDYMKHVVTDSPDTFFSSYTYSNSQDNFIDMVIQGTLDGAEVDSMMWSYIVTDSTDYSPELKIIYTSPPQLVPAIAFHPDVDKKLKMDVKTSLIRMHEIPEGKKVLENMHFDMFVEMDHETYAAYEDSLQRTR